jgi:hypothetical protein
VRFTLSWTYNNQRSTRKFLSAQQLEEFSPITLPRAGCSQIATDLAADCLLSEQVNTFCSLGSEISGLYAGPMDEA